MAFPTYEGINNGLSAGTSGIKDIAEVTGKAVENTLNTAADTTGNIVKGVGGTVGVVPADIFHIFQEIEQNIVM